MASFRCPKMLNTFAMEKIPFIVVNHDKYGSESGSE